MATGRIIPLTCKDEYRLACEELNLILDNEVHTTSDQKRVFMQGHHVGPVWHGDVENEVEMLALTSESPRGVFPIDHCYRVDTGTVWMCITNRGETIADWIELGGGVPQDVDDIIDGGAAANEFVNVIDGGNAAGEDPDTNPISDDIDGNPEI